MPYPLIPIGNSPWVSLIVTLIVIGIIVAIANWFIKTFGSNFVAAPMLQIVSAIVNYGALLLVLVLVLFALFGIQLFAGR